MVSPEDDAALLEAAALVVLLRAERRAPSHLADLIEEAGSAQDVLAQDEGLLAPDLARGAAAEVAAWAKQGVRIVTILDSEYPENLRSVHDRPPLIFVAGELQVRDAEAVAVIGSRRASAVGIEGAKAMTAELIAANYTIVSGLAAGIDTAAHICALDHGARTIAVIGTGLNRCYPPQNASLQRRIAAEGAVVSQFWPDAGPSRTSFPARNSVMSGLALATLIVEAGPTSGARIQARHALAHGRPVLLTSSLLDQAWAKELADRSGTHVVSSPKDLVETVGRLSTSESPTA